MQNASAGSEDSPNADHMGEHADTKDVLMEAAYLAGAMVDLIHGQWTSKGSGFPRQRIATTFHNSLNVSEALLSGASQDFMA